MRLIHIGVLSVLLLGGFELAAKGGFRKIYKDEADPVQQRTRCVQYLQEKMLDQYKLKSATDEKSEYRWNHYLFKQFVKLHLVSPQTVEEATGPDSQYRVFRATSMFMLRTANPLWGMKENGEFLQRLAQTTALLRNMTNSGNNIFQLTQGQIKAWIKAFRSGAPIQVKGNELKAKNSILQSWMIWVQKPEVQVLPKVLPSSVADEDDPFASPPAQRKAQ